jgi:formylglycine-generating enzyme required for sulfatase activity
MSISSTRPCCARRDEETGELVPYWPELYKYVEANRDRDAYRAQLREDARNWGQRSWPFRALRGASWRELWVYRKRRVNRVGKDNVEGRYLRASRRRVAFVYSCIALLIGYIVESFLTTHKLGLPMEAMPTLQRYRSLGYAPLPPFGKKMPPGFFDMGEQDPAMIKKYGEREPYLGLPNKKQVEIKRGFRLTATEVTFEQFDYYVWAQHGAGGAVRKVPSAPNSGRGRRPVVNIKWAQAVAYAKWLSERTKQDCRLPTEAEWEYAARAGKKDGYHWDNEVGENNASCKGCGGEWGKGEQSAPVASFKPNAWGLHDMSGNVWEWTCSPWREEFDGSEQKCAAADDSSVRVVRGGSWGSDAGSARSSARYDNGPADTYDGLGFRVLCLSPIE